MSIRKTGTVTGQVTEVEQVPGEGITATAASIIVGPGGINGHLGWTGRDESALSDENEAADEG